MPEMRKLERDVLGCDYGGTSWTTRAQAVQIVESLDLRPGIQLLDVGSGSGWPGLFLGSETGCDVTLLDNIFSFSGKQHRTSEWLNRSNEASSNGNAVPLAAMTLTRLLMPSSIARSAASLIALKGMSSSVA